MTITLNLPDEIARQLASQAQAQGLPIDAYVTNILAHAISPLSFSQPRKISQQEFAETLDAMAQYSDKIPAMPGETFSREMIYQDHD